MTRPRDALRAMRQLLGEIQRLREVADDVAPESRGLEAGLAAAI